MERGSTTLGSGVQNSAPWVSALEWSETRMALLRRLSSRLSLRKTATRSIALASASASAPALALALAAVVIPSLSAVAQSDPQSSILHGDARAQAMGRAYTALADAPSVVWWNPAALSFQDDKIYVAPFSYSKLVPDFSDDTWWFHGDAVWDAGPVGVGLHYRRLYWGESEIFDRDGTRLGTVSPTDDALHVGVGIDFVDLFVPENEAFSLGFGLALKRIGADFAPAGPFHSVAQEGSALDIDVGLLPRFHVPIEAGSVEASFGWTRKNLLESDIGEFSAGLGSLKSLDRFGTAVSVDLERSDIDGSFLRLTGTWDFAESRPAGVILDGKDLDFQHYGFEAMILQTLAIRIGHIRARNAGDIVGNTYGAGLRFDLPWQAENKRYGFQIDVATVPQASDLDRVSHYSGFFWIQP